jgi:PAS domain S-box-containing protein
VIHADGGLDKVRDELAGEVAALRRRIAELEDSDAFLRAILDSAPDIITVTNTAGTIQFVNRVAPGLEKTVVIGTTVYDHIAPEYHDVARACLEQVARTGEPGRYGCIGRGAHHQPAHYEVRVGPVVRDGSVVALTLISIDITEHVELEKRNNESREKLQVAAEAVGVGFWSWDRFRDEIIWDATMCTLFGLPLGKGPKNRREYIEMLPPPERDRIDRRIDRTLVTGNYEDRLYRLQMSDGGWRWLLVRGRALSDAHGEVCRLIGGVIDITDRMEAEDARRRSEEQYRSVVATLDEGVLLIDADGEIEACNPSAERILGLTQAELIGRKVEDGRWGAIHEDGSPFPGESHPSEITRRTGLPKNNIVMGVRKPNGELVWISVNSQPLRRPGESKPNAVVVSFSDITERKRADEELRSSEKRASFLAKASEVLAGSLDTATTLEAVARLAVPHLADLAVLELLDEEGQLGPDHPVVVVSSEPEVAERYQEMRRRFPLREGSPLLKVLRTGELKVLHRARDELEDASPVPEKDGLDPDHAAALASLRQRSSIIAPLAARGQRLGVLVFGTRKRAFGPEDVALAEEIARRAAVAIDNARLYKQAQAAVRVRDEFLSIASHELKTPLTPVMLRVQALLRTYRRAADGAVPADVVLPKLESIKLQLDRFRRLIDELLDVSRISAGRLPMEPEAIDLTAFLEELLGRYSEELKRTGCTLTFNSPGPVFGQWDQLRLEQIITNLISNAIKYGASGLIEVSLQESAGVARLLVCDHGIGLAPEDQERIFQRFERAVSARHYGGFGLGLWITRQVVEAMGGSIRVDSQLGHGSTFTVELPRAGAGGA